MGYLGRGVTRTLCTIRRPVVWYLEEVRYASLKDDRDDWERSSWDDPERSSDESETFYPD